MKSSPSLVSPLSPEELAERLLHEQRIKTRASGRIGDGLDLLRIRDADLCRDYQTFDKYVYATFGVAPGSAYRWMAAAEIVQEMVGNSPKGEDIAAKTLEVLSHHRNETAIRFLQELPSIENRWAVYIKGVELSKGHEPPPRLLRKAAQTLGLVPIADIRDSRTLSRARAFQLILDVRNSVSVQL